MQIGYTAGSRSRPRIGWARNIRRKLKAKELADLTTRSSSAFAFAWNMFQNQLPDEVMDDFNEYLTSSDIVRMHPSGKKHRNKKGEYTICNRGEAITFHNVDLAPPAGFFGVNYCRYAISFSRLPPSLRWCPLDLFTMSRVPTAMRSRGPQHASLGTKEILAVTSSSPTTASRSVQPRTPSSFGYRPIGMELGLPTVIQRLLTLDFTSQD